jgi:hypothetical protein
LPPQQPQVELTRQRLASRRYNQDHTPRLRTPQTIAHNKDVIVYFQIDNLFHSSLPYRDLSHWQQLGDPPPSE